jgi:Arc/MetJ family transcription regulator
MSSTPVNLRLEDDSLAWLREEAARQDRTIAWVVNEAVDAYRRSLIGIPSNLRLLEGELSQIEAQHREQDQEAAERSWAECDKHAEHAQVAFDAYETTGDDQEKLIDLLTDLLHLASRLARAIPGGGDAINPFSYVQQAFRHYLAETGQGSFKDRRDYEVSAEEQLAAMREVMEAIVAGPTGLHAPGDGCDRPC